MLTALLAFTPAAALLVAPGPDALLVLRNSARGGRRAGLVTAAGTVTGLLVWAAVAALGLAALVRASELGYTIVRWCGAAYLIFLGSRLLWRSRPAVRRRLERITGVVMVGFGVRLAIERR